MNAKGPELGKVGGAVVVELEPSLGDFVSAMISEWCWGECGGECTITEWVRFKFVALISLELPRGDWHLPC